MQDIFKTKIDLMNEIIEGKNDDALLKDSVSSALKTYYDFYDTYIKIEENLNFKEEDTYLLRLSKVKKHFEKLFKDFEENIDEEHEAFLDDSLLEDEEQDSLELGNMLFNENNKNQILRCPDYVLPILKGIDDEMSRIYWNKHQKEYTSPFSNSGNKFVCDVFEVHAYKWDTDEDSIQNYNFKYKDIEISWYKHVGRDMTINREVEPKEITDMYTDIMETLRVIERNGGIDDGWN